MKILNLEIKWIKSKSYKQKIADNLNHLNNKINKNAANDRALAKEQDNIKKALLNLTVALDKITKR